MASECSVGQDGATSIDAKSWCLQRLDIAEAENMEQENLAHRDILGYHQMVESMFMWVSHAKIEGKFPPASFEECFETSQAGQKNAAMELKASLLDEHARTVVALAELRAARR